MYENPLVSVCIPVFNGENTIDEALQSIINQTYKNIEIIISDNASTDDTLKHIRCYNDPRITIYTNNTSTVCGGKNMSKCIELANGEYIAIFHADDVYLPEIIEKEVRMFQKHPEIGAVFTKNNVIDSNGNYIGESKTISEFKGKETLEKEEVFLNLLKYRNIFLCCPSAMVKRDIYKKLCPFRYHKFPSACDLDMWLRILNNYKISIIDEKLMNYRISETQGSAIDNYLRTEREDGLNVLDFYLNNEFRKLQINSKIRDAYKIHSDQDTIFLAKNNLIIGDVKRSQKILSDYYFNGNISFMIKNIWHLKYTEWNIIGFLLLISIYGKFNKFLLKALQRFTHLI